MSRLCHRLTLFFYTKEGSKPAHLRLPEAETPLSGGAAGMTVRGGPVVPVSPVCAVLSLNRRAAGPEMLPQAVCSARAAGEGTHGIALQRCVASTAAGAAGCSTCQLEPPESAVFPRGQEAGSAKS